MPITYEAALIIIAFIVGIWLCWWLVGSKVISIANKISADSLTDTVEECYAEAMRRHGLAPHAIREIQHTARNLDG